MWEKEKEFIIMNNKSMVNNTLYAMLSKGVAMLGFMILDIYVARKLDVKTYAEWAFFYSIISMLFLFGWIGINVSSKVYISKLNSDEDRKRCYSITFFLRFVSSILISLIIFLLVYCISNAYSFSEAYPNLRKMLPLCSAMVFFNSISEYFKEISVGLDRFRELFMFTVCEYVGYVVGVILCLQVNTSPISVPIGYIFGGIFVFAVGMFHGKKNYFVHVKEKNEIRDTCKNIVQYALPIALMGIGGIFLLEMDTFMLGLLSTNEQLSTYSIAKQWCSKASHINLALSMGVMTSFSLLNKTNINEKALKFKRISIINFAVTVVVMISLIYILPFVLILLYGKEYREVTPILKILAVYYGLYGISTFYATFLDFQNKAKVRSIYYCSIIVINFVMNIILIPRYGANGAAIATIISLIPYTVGVFIESNKCLRLHRK